jgi:transcriptional regulator with XRE-family HTH domain
LTGKDFKDLRTEAGLSQQKMAQLLGKSLTAVRNWEKDRTPIDNLVAEGIISRTRGLVANGQADQEQC